MNTAKRTPPRHVEPPRQPTFSRDEVSLLMLHAIVSNPAWATTTTREADVITADKYADEWLAARKS